MSTELTPVKGEYEMIYNHEPRSAETEMQITSFSGGIQKGAMIQLTPQHGYIQLTRGQVMELITTLSNWL
jgi:hypothetical protein